MKESKVTEVAGRAGAGLLKGTGGPVPPPPSLSLLIAYDIWELLSEFWIGGPLVTDPDV